jgi:D-alanine-D-alanine ligase-like ATP-grasp enzyme
MKYNKTNGYYKFWNKDGKYCKIKVEDEIKNEKIIVSFIKNAGEVQYHSPDKIFKNTVEVIHFLLKNLETDGIIFKISKSSTIK